MSNPFKVLLGALALVGCGDATLTAPTAPTVERASAPACGAGDCVSKSSGMFPGDPGVGLVFIDYAATRQRSNRPGEVLNDVLTHLPPNYGNTYYDDDPITHAHETSHGIHSDIRNNHNNTGVRANGFYVLEGRAVLVAEPNIRKSQAAPFIPQSLRGSRFDLYVTGSQAWDDTPLYLWDEWNAYINGGAAGVDLVNNGHWDRGWRDGVAGQLEFTVYAIAVAMAVRAHDPAYFDSNTQFKELLAWNTRRAMEIYRAGKDLEPFRWERQETYHQQMREAADAEEWRAFCREVFGPQWADAVLFGDGAVPQPEEQPEEPPEEQPEQPEEQPEPPEEQPEQPDEPDLPPPPENLPPPPDDNDDPLGNGDGDEPQVDSDSDGIADGADLCSATARGAVVWQDGDWKGCAAGQIRDRDRRAIEGPDADGDGVGDGDDKCSATPNGANVWREGDWSGCAEGQFKDPPRFDGADADGDGIGDDVDLCSATPELALVWTEGEWIGCAEGQQRD